MECLIGKSVYEGIVFAKVHIDLGNEKNFKTDINPIKDVEREKARLELAVEKGIESLQNLKSTLHDSIEKKKLQIIDAHLMLIRDPLYLEDIKECIEKKFQSAEVAVDSVTQKYIELFEKIESPLYKQRILDIKDVSNRIIDILTNSEEKLKNLDGKILITKEIYPTELLQLYQSNISLKGIIMEYGGETSHVAILAKAFKIPTIMGVKNVFAHNWTQDIILDTTENSSCVILQPTEEQIKLYSKKKKEIEEKNKKIDQGINLPSITKDGEKISLYLNIGDVEKSSDIIDNKSVSGVGLFRTELIYMKSNSFPDEEKQVEIYRDVLKRFDKEQSIVIRTLDIGADKQLDYLELQEERNPFLGLRGIRFSLQNKDIFKIQLRAILRISAERKVKIMYPMVTNLEEIDRANKILEEVKKEFKDKNQPFDKNIEIGIMVEVPSVIMMAEEFAQKIDFFSIGSNDLTQYVLATDRLSETVREMYDSYNPAVFRAINQIKKAADKYGKPISVCGEMAGNPRSILGLLILGIENLSMVETSIGTAKNLIRNIDYSQLKSVKESFLKCKTSEEVKTFLNKYMNY